MTTRIERERLEAELQQLNELLAVIPEADVISRAGLVARKTEVEATLESSPALPRTFARATLAFNGGPVVGTKGIEATFAGAVTKIFQDLVAKIHAVGSLEEIREFGPIPGRREATLHIVDVARSSFGFVLEELNPQLEVEPSQLQQSVEETQRLITSASEGDEAFAEELAGVDARVHKSLTEFFDIIKNADAVFRLTTERGEVSFTRDQVQAAAARVSDTNIEETPQDVRGRMLGILPHARRFEILVGDDVWSGAISKDSPLDIERASQELIGKQTRAQVFIRTVRRRTTTRTSYTLVTAELEQ